MTHPRANTQLLSNEINERIKGYGNWIEIDLDALTHNLNEIRKNTFAEVMPCVKNNAYGHGLIPIASHLYENGVKRFLVAKTNEAIAISDQVGANAVNMDHLWTPQQNLEVVDRGISQIVFTFEAAKNLSIASTSLGKPARIFVKVDTGLRRVGVWHEEAPELIERILKLSGIKLEGIISTLMQTPNQDKISVERIKAVAEELRSRNINPGALSLASTDATLNNPEAHLDLVRPGMSIYGVFPEAKDRASNLKLRQVLSWKAKLEYAKTIEKGDSVTYWGRFTAPEKMRIGTIHVGFYDGIPREMANKARIKIGDMYRTSCGSVSLNHILVDLREVNVKEGDTVEIIGPDGENTLSKFSDSAGWMVYSVLNHLNQNIPRVYFKKDKPDAILEA
jgi:alanine racemase